MSETQNAWEREYRNKNFMSGTRPQKSFLRFVKKLKKDLKQDENYDSVLPFKNLHVLDLGSGEGKNALYLAERSALVTGIEFSKTAIQNASRHKNITYINASFAEKLPFDDKQFDIALDITSSNALTAREREHFLNELSRVLKDSGQLFLRTLCKDGDKNAKMLLKSNPYKNEKDMYIMPTTGLVERVFAEQDIRALYAPHFTITHLEKETHYTTIADTKFKRNFWVAYLLKK